MIAAIMCEEPRVYSACGPANPTTCRDIESSHNADNTTQCSEGCFCPPGLIDDGTNHDFYKYLITCFSFFLKSTFITQKIFLNGTS